ncbi:MAG: phosphoribosylaminoimidazolesuccinocarboxamide synthase [Candidatus Kaelpia imicola]|nr:phosphoribosylaminoimidazolesuccinocarboxamide synthase [Candidatus Kaelpia imicola]
MKVNSVKEISIESLNIFRRGKVRDIYELNGDLLFVATDRISCFDVVLPDPIPLKGIVLNKLSLFWFDLTKDLVSNHLISSDVSEVTQLSGYHDILKDRSIIVKKTEPLPFECVVRGYLSGSGWKDYKKEGKVSGVELKKELLESQKLDQPIFTPSTKEDSGHDMAVSFDYVADKIGLELASKIRDKSLELYFFAHNYAETRGIIIADTKFEFGILDGKLILIDEVLTPDSSRFWPKDEYTPGRAQNSFDKQYVRDWLESTGWDKTPPAPNLPQEVIEKTTQKYLFGYKNIAGVDLQ